MLTSDTETVGYSRWNTYTPCGKFTISISRVWFSNLITLTCWATWFEIHTPYVQLLFPQEGGNYVSSSYSSSATLLTPYLGHSHQKTPNFFMPWCITERSLVQKSQRHMYVTRKYEHLQVVTWTILQIPSVPSKAVCHEIGPALLKNWFNRFCENE